MAGGPGVEGGEDLVDRLAAPLGVAGVDHDRQLELDGDLDLGGEGAALIGGRRRVAVVVEPGLADRPHLLVGAEPRRSSRRPPRRRTRPPSWGGGRPRRRPPRGARRRRSRRVGLGVQADVEHPPHPRRARRRDHLGLGPVAEERGACGSRSPASLSLSRRIFGSGNSLLRMADPADYYREIYMRGLGGETPAVPVSIAELERAAVAAMEPRAANYVGAGAGSEDTIRANAEAFRRAPDRAADAARRRQPRPLDHRPRDGDAGAADAGADRRPEGRRTRTASWRPPAPQRRSGRR